MIGIRDFKPYNTPAIDLPPAGSAYIDPIFGTRVIRVTDEHTGRLCTHAYSWWPAWNFGESMLLVFIDNVPTIVPWMGDNGPDWAHAFPLVSVPGCPPAFDAVSAQWDRSDGRYLYVLETTPKGGDQKQRIVRFNLLTRMASELWRFKELPGCELDGLSMSENGQAVGFTATGADGTKTACVWDRSFRNDRLIKYTGGLPTPLHSTTISADGQWLQIAASNPTPDIVYWRWRDDFRTTMLAADKSDTGLIQHAFLARSGLVAGVASTNGIALRRWEDFQPRSLITFPSGLPGVGYNWRIAHHVAVRRVAGAEVSVIISTYLGEGTPGGNQIIEVAIDGSWWRSLAHTRATAGGDYLGPNYWHQPRASVSPSGKWVIWTSDLGQADRTDVLVMEVPPADEVLERDEDADEHMTDLMQERDAARAELASAQAELATARTDLATARTDLATARALGDSQRVKMLAAIADLGTP